MRKIWKCSPFFWKIFNFFQLHENRASLSSSGIFPNFWKSVPLFVCFFEQNLPLHQPYHRLGTVFGHFKFKSNPPKSGFHSPTTEVISKTLPLLRCYFWKKFKKSSPHHWLSRLPPCFVTPFLNFFQKFLSLHHWLSQKHPALYHPVLHFFLKNFQSPPLIIAKTYQKRYTFFALFLRNLPER